MLLVLIMAFVAMVLVNVAVGAAAVAKTKKNVRWCGCMQVRSPKEGFADIFSRTLVDGKPRGELWELFSIKSFEEFKDELSDIFWGVGRIIGGFLGKAYVRVPGDRIHYRKVVGRIEEYGCMRSKRFLVNGRCPNE